MAVDRSDKLLPALSPAASVAHDVFGSAGLTVNYLQCKTEALAGPLGVGREQALHSFLAEADATVPCTSS